MSRAVARAPQFTGASCVIEISNKFQINEKFVVNSARITIGRGGDNDLVIKGDSKCSRNHAAIEQIGTDFRIVKLSEKNIVLVNDQSVTTKELVNGDVICLGETKLKMNIGFVEATGIEESPLSPVPFQPQFEQNADQEAASPGPIQGSSLPELPGVEKKKNMAVPEVIKPAVELPPLPQVKDLHLKVPFGSKSFPTATSSQVKMNPEGGPSNLVPFSGQNSVSPYSTEASPSYGAPASYTPPSTAYTPPSYNTHATGYESYSSSGSAFASGKGRFYMIVGGIALVVGFFLFTGDGVKKQEIGIRTEEEVAADLKRSQDTQEALKKKKEETQKNGTPYMDAQAYFIKGFRDYRQGNYERAVQAFSTAQSIYPDHELAKHYQKIAKRRFSEQIQFNMIQGRKYLERNNYRLCKSAFSNVMTMVKNKQDPNFAQAQQLYEECNELSKDRY